MGPKPLFERVFFSLKSLFLRGVQWHILGIQCCPSDCDFWLERIVRINGPGGTVRYLDLVMGAMTGAQWVRNDCLRGSIFGIKSQFLRGVQRHILGLQCHQSGCNVCLERFGWINRSLWTYPMSSFGDGGHARCSMGPKRLLERVVFSLKLPFLRGIELCSWPPMSPKWLEFLVGMVWMEQWDLGDMTDV